MQIAQDISVIFLQLLNLESKKFSVKIVLPESCSACVHFLYLQIYTDH